MYGGTPSCIRNQEASPALRLALGDPMAATHPRLGYGLRNKAVGRTARGRVVTHTPKLVVPPVLAPDSTAGTTSHSKPITGRASQGADLAAGLNGIIPAPSKSRVVVTGAAGFIGSHLVDALLTAGHEVVALDRRNICDDVIAAANLTGAMAHSRLCLHRVELATDDLAQYVTGADTVFHLAGLPGVRNSWGARFNGYVTANVLATNRLLAACEGAGVRRMVFASSSSVYGSARRPSREDDPTGPASPYGVTKLAAEHLCLAHAHRNDTALTVVALRYFTVYGPRQRPGMAIGQMLLAALAGVAVPLFGDGHQRREFTYVDDVVAATMAAATADISMAVINVGGGSSVAILDVVDLAATVTGKPVRVLPAAHQAGDVAATEADLSRAREFLAYRPRVSLREGMTRQAEWLTVLPESLRMSLLSDRQELVS